jgi:1-acyl-sn-glycerol-3-phosphate acyltransferase
MPRGIYYFAKSELFGKWYSSFLVESLNTIPVKRGGFDRKIIERGVEIVGRGDWLLVFPEGTRSKNGRLGKGRNGAARISVESGVPVVPACIVNSNRLSEVLFSKSRVAIRLGQPLYPRKYQEAGSGKEMFSSFTSDIMDRIQRLLKSENAL